ncbi:hypothetical protein [Nocardiopsis sp. CNT312]|uniref:hypothetical protein n=1 Tax=Nocardiopsis sp. CNT312 TaxID=1137268 RepID=UPI0004AF70D7|nr:hypothetical protein [Nocardiopsis sp. CNT312]
MPDHPPSRAEEAAPTRPRRTPLVIKDPPDRRLTALWILLGLTWLVGTPASLAALLFHTMDAALDTADSLTALRTSLAALLLTGLALPACAAATAALLRRPVPALLFTTALALTATPLLLTVAPAELWAALTTDLTP